MWKAFVERDRPQMTVRRMRIACLLPKATDIYTKYLTLIACPQQHGCTNSPQSYVIRMFSAWPAFLCFLLRKRIFRVPNFTVFCMLVSFRSCKILNSSRVSRPVTTINNRKSHYVYSLRHSDTKFSADYSLHGAESFLRS
jgi:hypothetical protein